MGYLLVKDVYGRYLLTFKSRKFDYHQEDAATGTFMLDVLYPHGSRVLLCRTYNMSWRGLTALLILVYRQCEKLEDWDKREVETPTSFLVSYPNYYLRLTLGVMCGN